MLTLSKTYAVKTKRPRRIMKNSKVKMKYKKNNLLPFTFTFYSPVKLQIIKAISPYDLLKNYNIIK